MRRAPDQLDVTLRDVGEDRDNSVAIRIDCRETGINICPIGYGDSNSEPGNGAPIYLELYEGELRLLVWSDINSEEPTHVISLEGAKEDRRDNVIPVG